MLFSGVGAGNDGRMPPACPARAHNSVISTIATRSAIHKEGNTVSIAVEDFLYHVALARSPFFLTNLRRETRRLIIQNMFLSKSPLAFLENSFPTPLRILVISKRKIHLRKIVQPL